MPVDFQIRPIGRPQVSEDSSLGYRKLVRRYAVEGPKVSKEGIDSSPELFRKVGEADEEFDDYFLVAQQVEPTSTVDKAHLSRTFVQFRDSWFSESVSENRESVRLSRRYMVLKQSETVLAALNLASGNKAAGLGYPDPPGGAWSLHPSSSGYTAAGDNTEPWDMLPSIIVDTEPSDGEDGVLDAATAHPFSYTISNLTTILGALGYTNGIGNQSTLKKWVRGSAQVDTSNPGFDVWNVSWVAPSEGFWVTGSAAGGGGSPPTVVSIDEHGLTATPIAATNTSQTVTSFTFYHVSSGIPPSLAAYVDAGTPYVFADFKIFGKDKGIESVSHVFKNAVFDLANNTAVALEFPDTSGTPQSPQSTEVASKQGHSRRMVFNFDAGPPANPSGGGSGGWTGGGWVGPLPFYQNQEIIRTGGHISWTHEYFGTPGLPGNLVKATAMPIHSYRGQHIWKITLTYA